MLRRFGARQKMHIKLFGEPEMGEFLLLMELVGEVRQLIIELPYASENLLRSFHECDQPKIKSRHMVFNELFLYNRDKPPFSEEYF